MKLIDHRPRRADCLGWSDDIRYELIDGVVYLMAPAPTMSHREIAGKICGWHSKR